MELPSAPCYVWLSAIKMDSVGVTYCIHPAVLSNRLVWLPWDNCPPVRQELAGKALRLLAGGGPITFRLHTLYIQQKEISKSQQQSLHQSNDTYGTWRRNSLFFLCLTRAYLTSLGPVWPKRSSTLQGLHLSQSGSQTLPGLQKTCQHFSMISLDRDLGYFSHY